MPEFFRPTSSPITSQHCLNKIMLCHIKTLWRHFFSGGSLKAQGGVGRSTWHMGENEMMQNSLRYVVRHWGIGLNHYIYMDMENMQDKPSAVKNICGCYHFRDDFSVFGRAVISQPLRIFVNAVACWTGHSASTVLLHHGWMAGSVGVPNWKL